MFGDIFDQEGICMSCGRYATLNQFRICRLCHANNQWIKKSRNLKPVRIKKPTFGHGNWTEG